MVLSILNKQTVRKFTQFEKQAFGFPAWVLLVLILVFLLRIPSLFEPYWYGDEAIYLSLGEGIREGRTLYSEMHDNKPPLLYIIAAVAGNVFWFRTILMFWHILTIILFWHLTTSLFSQRERMQKIAVIIFTFFTTIPLLEGNIANSEIFMIGPTIAAFLILLSKNLQPKMIFIAGLLFSIASLFKIPAAFDVPVIIIFWLVYAKLKQKELLGVAQKTVILAAGYFSPILITFVWYYLKGAFNEYLFAAFLQNVGYLSAWRPDIQRESFLVRNGPLLLRGTILAAGSFLLAIKQKSLDKTFVLLSIWTLFALFGATLSGRPYPHYLIQVVPPASLLGAILIANTKKEQTLAIIPLALVFATTVYFNFYTYPTVPYYRNFIEFAAGTKNKQAYFEYFDKRVPKIYEISSYLRENSLPSDRVLIWSNNPEIHALSRRLPSSKFVAFYHISDFDPDYSITFGAIDNNPPAYIVTNEDVEIPGRLDAILQKSYIPIYEVEKFQIWKYSSLTSSSSLL